MVRGCANSGKWRLTDMVDYCKDAVAFTNHKKIKYYIDALVRVEDKIKKTGND